MLFDLQGKRKRLIQVIYAMLALLMGGGLVLFGIGGEVSGGLMDAFNNQPAQSGDMVKEAERLQERADEEPQNKQVLTRLIRARYTAGNNLFEIDENGQPQMTSEAREQFELAADTWRQYLDLNPKPVDVNVAQLVANALFSLAQSATDGMGARVNSAAAAEAQRYFAEARPSVGSLSTLAIYSYFGNDFKGGDAAVEQLLALNSAPAAKKRNKRQMDEYRKQAKQFQDQLDAYEKAMKAGSTDDSPAAPQILSPSGGLSGATGP